MFGKKKAPVVVRILYKSGQHIDFECDEFSVTKGVKGLESVRWKRKGSMNKPMFMGIDNIEAIWQIK